MSSCQCCQCCKSKITYDLDNLTEGSQILPSLNKNITITDNKLDRNIDKYRPPLSDTNNMLITYGNINYDEIFNLNELVGKNKKIDVKNIVFGEQHSLMLIEIIDENNPGKTFKLYGIGSNENGELGLDYSPKEENTYKKWTEIDVKSKISKNNFIFWGNMECDLDDIFIGNKFSLITVKMKDKSLGLYRFQLNKDDKYEILTNESINDKKCCIKLEKFNTIYNRKDNGGIKKVAVFNDRIIILANNNSIFIKGISFDMTNSKDYIFFGEFKENIKDISIGMNNCLLVGDSNTIYGIGYNEYGEFGINDSEYNENNKENLEKINYKKNLFFKEQNKNIIKISSGARHSIVLCDDGHIYCFGDNTDGQCCGLEKVVKVPSLINFENKDEIIIDIKAGFNHSMVKGASGKVYVWGDSAWDKLGFKETRIDQFEPVEVSDMKIRNVIRFFAGPMQSAFFISGGLIIDI